MKVKRFSIGIIIIIISLMFGCSNTNHDVTSLTLGTFSKSLGNAPYHIAKYFNWFEQNPSLKDIKFTYEIFNDRPTISQAFDKNELQMLLSAEVPAILCKAQGNDIKIVEISGIVTVEILGKKDLNISSIEDLKNKKIAVLQGTSSHYGLLTSILNSGLSLSDINLIYMGPTEARTAFETGKIDAWAVWSPFIEEQEILNKSANVIKGGNTIIANVVTIPTSLIKYNPKIVQALIEVLHRAKKWIIENPQDAAPIIAEDLGIDIRIVQEALKKFDYSKYLDMSSILDFQNKAQFLSDQEKTRKSINIDIQNDMIDLSFTKMNNENE